METNEISELAKTYAEAILTNKLTKAEVVMLLACINARVENVLSTAISPVTAPVKAYVATPAPEPPKPQGQKIADKGYPCVCIMCNKHIYTLKNDLYDNTTVKDFIDAYLPMPGFPLLSKQTKISNIDNNITTNCPSCNGEFTLYLAGRQIG